MNTQALKSMHMPLSVAGIAAILFSTVAMAIVPIMEWFHGSLEGSDGIVTQGQLPETIAVPPAPSGAGKARVKARCDECGVIHSMRRVAPVGNSPAIYEITVRLGDGSTHVLSDASPANWRPGERINLIGGGNRHEMMAGSSKHNPPYVRQRTVHVEGRAITEATTDGHRGQQISVIERY
jgi:hypothetical protein